MGNEVLVEDRSNINSENESSFRKVGNTRSLHNSHLIDKLHLNQCHFHLLNIQSQSFIDFIHSSIDSFYSDIYYFLCYCFFFQ